MRSFSRRSFVKVAVGSAAALSLGSALSACSSKESAAPVADEPTQVIISMTPGSEPAAGFDPLVSWGCGEHVHEPLIQSTLFTTNQKLELVGDLATDWKCSDDGMSWTFNLREGVKFTDGEALDADDVAFTINSIIKSDKSEADLSMVKEAKVVSATQVELQMNKPNNALLYTLAVVGIVPEHAYGDGYGAAPIGSGRYIMKQWDQGQQVIFEANPDYYGEAPKMQRVIVLFMEEDASLAAAQKGEVDVAYTSATLSDTTVEGYDLFVCDSVDSRGISLPCIEPGGSKRMGMDGEEHDAGNLVTSDIAIRRAMNMAVDREALIKDVLNGYGTVAYSVGDGLPWASEDMRVEMDVDGAKKLLDEAGWKMGADGVRAKDSLAAEFTMLYAANDSVRQAMANSFAAQMKDLGIKVNIKGGDWDTDLYPHEFDTPVLWGWGSNAPVEMYELSYSTGWGNVACWDDKTIDKNLDKALAQPTLEESYEYYKKAQWDEKTQTGVGPKGASSWIWLANVDHLYFARAGLKIAEQKPHPHGHGWSLVNNVDQWSW